MLVECGMNIIDVLEKRMEKCVMINEMKFIHNKPG